jgi:hypothetical protein
VSINDKAAAPFDAYLHSPGDVAGFDANQVIRTDPVPGASNVEPNYFPFIEFARPDLPWMLTPSTPHPDTASDPRLGLLAWLVLVVIPKDSATIVAPSASNSSTNGSVLLALETTPEQLPDLSESWLWAHAQVLTTGAAAETIDGIIATEPHRALSRLIAPRRLLANTAYVACVVPAFDAGRDAGTGRTPSSPTLGWAWQANEQTVTLPIYYKWEFSTGDEGGDFASLAKLLTPYDSSTAGIRRLDVGEAAGEIGLHGPGAGDNPWLLNLEGVLVGANVAIGQWDVSVPEDTFRKALAAKLDGKPDDLPPPTYGSSQAEFIGPRPTGNEPTPLSGFDTTTKQWFHGSLANGDGAVWLRTLNLDPRYRVMAALGTEVVQQYQEALMASAWEQAGELRKVSELLARGQLAREANGFIYRKRIGPNSADAPLADDRLMQITTAIHSQVSAPAGMESGGSIAGAVAENASLQSALSTSFRRLTRPSGPLAKRISTVPLPSSVLPIASGTAVVTPPLQPVTGQVSIDRLSANEVSLSKIDPALVQTRVFPWEPTPATVAGLAKPKNAAVTAAAPVVPTVPYGFMADLLVTTAGFPTVIAEEASWVGSVLDFNGVPQLGWGPPRAEAVRNVTTLLPPAGYGIALTYVDFAGRNGLITFTTEVAPLGQLDPIGDSIPWQLTYGFYNWFPGYLLDGNLSKSGWGSLGSPPYDYILGPSVDSLSVAATDLTGNGNIDLIFVWSTGTWTITNPDYGFDFYSTYLKVGRGLDASGNITGGWTGSQLIGSAYGTLSITAMGRQVCIWDGSVFRVVTLGLDPTGSDTGDTGKVLSSQVSAAFAAQLPPDLMSGAIASAAFGVAGMDVIFCFNAVSNGQVRIEYRLLFDVKGDGSIGGLGDVMSLPIPTSGGMQLQLGVMTSASAALRTQKTQDFRTAATATQTRQQRILALAAPPPPPPPVPLASLAQQLRSAIDPNVTVPASVLGRLQPQKINTTTPVSDVLQPAQSGPYFPQAMYETLRDLYPDRILPGNSAMPDNRITLVEANTKAIEAFLIGLNAYMAHSLLWHRFPGSLQATYFDRFWDARDATGFPLSDITPINGWILDSDLGNHAPGYTGNTHSNTTVDGLSANVLLAGWQPGMKIADAEGDIPRGTTIASIAAGGLSLTLSQPATGSHVGNKLTVAVGNPLVLLARGELLRRVPHVTIFAVPVRVVNGTRTLDVGQRRDPVFTGRLNPDIAFFGFNLTADEARGDGNTAGWYIVFQEHPTAPRFGPNEPGHSGNTHSNTTVDSLSANVLLAGWQPGMAITDADGDIPPGTTIVSVAADGLSLTLSQAATGSHAGDRLIIFGSKPAQWRDLNWSQLVASPVEYEALTYISCSKSPLAGISLTDDGTARQHQFGFSAAHMAHIMFRPAVQVAIHASLLLPSAS